MVHRSILLVSALALLGACSSGPAPGPRPPTTATTATSTTAAPEPIVEAVHGCGPADGAQVRVTGRSVGPDEVVIEVVFDETVYDRSWPMTGPRVGQVFDTQLPQAAFDAGSAEVRIVRADDRGVVVADGRVRLDDGIGCG